MSSSGVAGPPRTETIRFRRPEAGEHKKATIRPLRHTGILQDQVRRYARSSTWRGRGLTDLAIADLPKGHGRQTLRGQSDGCYSSASRLPCTRTSPTVTKVRVILYGTTPLYLWPLAVFNFWEPLHLFDRGYGFQTWEVSPEYSIRSWAYIVLHWFPVQLSKIFIGPDKVRLPPQL